MDGLVISVVIKKAVVIGGVKFVDINERLIMKPNPRAKAVNDTLLILIIEDCFCEFTTMSYQAKHKNFFEAGNSYLKAEALIELLEKYICNSVHRGCLFERWEYISKKCCWKPNMKYKKKNLSEIRKFYSESG